MKKVLITFCFILMVGIAHADYAYGEKGTASKGNLSPSRVPAYEKVVHIYTYNSTIIASFDKLDMPIPAETGYLFMALSPSEHIEFQDGNIIRYINVETSPEQKKIGQKAFFTPAIEPMVSGGGLWDNEPVITSIRVFDSTPQKRTASSHVAQEPLKADSLTIKLADKECKMTYAAQKKTIFFALPITLKFLLDVFNTGITGN